MDRERIVEIAGALIDDEGLAAFSMRKLARALGVEPMSLYHWFPSKDHVLDALLDRFASRIATPDTGPWDERLATMARSFRRATSSNPGAFAHFAVHRFNTEICLSVLDGLLGCLIEVHPDPARRAAAFRLLMHWMMGFCLDETSGFSKGPSAREPVADEVVAERFPRVAELGPFNRPEHFDALFEAGLAAVVAGIRALDDRQAQRGSPAG